MSEPARDKSTGPGTDEPAAAQDVPQPEDGPGLPPPTAVESLVNALLESGPEVAEHVVRAAQELVLAAQVIVDAAQAAVHEQQDLRTAATDEDGEPEAGASVHHLDRSE
jgi:hypothetical protein